MSAPILAVPHLMALIVETHGSQAIYPSHGEFCVITVRDGGMVQGTSRYVRTLTGARRIAKKDAGL